MKNVLPKRFKYTLVIKQKILSEICPKISMEDAALLDYLMGMCTSNNKKIADQRDDGYTWVNFQKIIDDNPLLKAKTKGPLTTRIKKIEAYGLLKTKTTRKYGLPRKFIKLTPLSERLLLQSGSSKYYKVFLSLGINEPQALEMAGDKAFLSSKAIPILKTIKTRKIEGTAASYLYKTYKHWLEENR